MREMECEKRMHGYNGRKRIYIYNMYLYLRIAERGRQREREREREREKERKKERKEERVCECE